ncbi:Cullin binding-domain-containing protein [Staphylotrichum tortipilum]|uniref:Defective in cullin neddylation protein n=1 Tax=Staphylotrichum tortipilum TaxID=2831512 RepID=A0AAN6MRG6_9PEZI|nr:Cullin binding-domain-containing protein [Staphylotrichum longicolle]
MVRRFFNSCFQKRPGRQPADSPHQQHQQQQGQQQFQQHEGAATETDGSDATLVSAHLQHQQHQHTHWYQRQHHHDQSAANHKFSANTTTTSASSSTTKSTAPPPTTKDPTKVATTTTPSKPPASQANPTANATTNPANATPKPTSTKRRIMTRSTKAKAPAKQANLDSQNAYVEKELEALFDTLEPKSSPTTLTLDGVAAYYHALSLDEASHEYFVLSSIVQSPGFGQITRAGFVAGWKQAFTESGGLVLPDMASHRAHARAQAALVRSDREAFKKVYKAAFVGGKEMGQREMGMEMALAWWGELFKVGMEGGKGWKGEEVDWFGRWEEFLTGKFWVAEPGAVQDDEEEEEGGRGPGRWTRTASRDLWNQTLLFAEKSMKDETLGFWSEEQAWPALIDEFVVWCREKGIAKAGKGEAEGMEE